MLVAPQPGTRVAMGPEAVRASVCLIMAKEAVALHRFAARTIRIRHSGDCRPQGEVCAREVMGPGAAIGKWRDPISSRHPDLYLWYVRLWPHAAEEKGRTAVDETQSPLEAHERFLSRCKAKRTPSRQLSELAVRNLQRARYFRCLMRKRYSTVGSEISIRLLGRLIAGEVQQANTREATFFTGTSPKKTLFFLRRRKKNYFRP